ncbi:NAD(P)H-binding protein [Micrococcus porci]|uniref:NAD(P)H-binding protein n=1 Tax=Micrococcus porci TaxID=2856555 RepID=UPI001CCB3A18|nr:NAD(P)H-binding protein [Micrococcus porci]UBH24020.1 NAD(P)H-binding protein [Micrococcus porci]
MRIAVTTPMGHVGRHVTSMLIRSGVRPLLLARRPENVTPGLRKHADIVKANSTDPAQVTAATQGVDAIYWVDPSVMSSDPLADYTLATEALVKAVTANGIGRVVFQSSIGAEKRHGVGEIDGLAGTEVALDTLDVDVTHLRCGYFFTNLLLDIDAVRQGQLTTVLPLDQPMSWVAPRDIAEVASLTLLNTQWHGHRVQAVHGPQDLSWRQVAETLTAHVGHQVHAEQITDTEMLQRYLAAGMAPMMADAILGMSTGLRDGFRPEQPRTLATTTPTTLTSWIHEELIPVL